MISNHADVMPETVHHPHDQYGEPIPLVNSPRLGMCGYDGPAAVNRGEQQVADILVEMRE